MRDNDRAKEEMPFDLSYIFGVEGIVRELLKFLQNYMKKRQIKDMLISGLKDETNRFLEEFEAIKQTAENDLFPAIYSVHGALTRADLQKLVESVTTAFERIANLIRVFSNFAKACRDVSCNRAFMDDLKDTDSALYDFVERVGEVYVDEKKLKIGSAFYRFFKIYEQRFKKILKTYKNTDVKDITARTKEVIVLLKQQLRKPEQIHRKVRKKFLKSLQDLRALTEQLSVELPESGVRAFVPENLRALVDLVDELVTEPNRKLSRNV